MKSDGAKRLVGALGASGVVAGVTVMALLASWVRVPTVAEPIGTAQTQPGLMIMRADRLPMVGGVREQIWLLDPAQLFMPDGASIGQGGTTGLASRSGGQAEKTYPAAMVFPERQPAGGLLRHSKGRTVAEEAASLAESRWFEGMARNQSSDVRTDPSLMRAARFELFQVGQSGPEVAFDLRADEILSTISWMPLELSLRVLDTGTLTRPVLVTSSGNERVDDRIRWLVGRDLFLKTKLRPGLYRLEVGP